MIIYKYLDPKSAIKTIENNSILVRTPNEYNDPSDCLFDSNKKERHRSLKLLENYTLFKKMYQELVIKKNILVFGEKYTEIVKKTIIVLANSVRKNKKYKWQPDIAMYYKLAKIVNKKTKNEEMNVDEDELQTLFDDKIYEILESIRKTILVGCFGLEKNSVLMWSHYALHHTGACVEFEINSEDFKKVRYSKKLTNFELTKAFEIALGYDFVGEKVNYDDEELQFVLKPVFTKYIDWKYEKEVRCGFSAKKLNEKIYPGKDDKGNPIKLLKMPPIRRIYIGCNADESFIDDVKKAHKDIPLYKMVREKGKYTLVAKPLEEQD